MQKWIHPAAASVRFAAAALLSCTAVLPLAALEKAAVRERLAAASPVSFDVFIPIQHRDQLDQLLVDLNTAGSPNYHKWLTPQQFHQRFSATSADLANIQQDLAAAGLNTTEVEPRHLHVTGTAGSIERTFSTELHNAVLPGGATHAAAVRTPLLPNSLQRLNAVVVGLSANIRMRKNSVTTSPNNRYSNVGPYWFTDLKEAYKFPSYQTGITGKGVSIAILMSGAFKQSDMTLFFGHEKLATPSFKQIKVDGGSPFDPEGSVESHLDLQQSGGMAPDAEITLYNIPDLSDLHILHGLTRIIEDNKADVVNMSFGGPEAFYTAEYNDGVDYTANLRLIDDVFAQGNAQGISFVASSGDSGGLATPPLACFTATDASPCGSYRAGVQFPASSPHVTGVGGTNLQTTVSSTSLDSAYVSENAFFDPLSADIFYNTAATGAVWGSGGGDSVVFKKPDFQRLVKTGNPRFRTVPDVAGHEGGCPGGSISCSPNDSAVVAAIGGQYVVLIGTSASAPDFAGLLALAVQRYGYRLGNANELIYTLAAAQKSGIAKGIYNWRIPGDNGVYTSGNTGYNRVLGNGTVNGAAFLLGSDLPLAGTPQTPSNP